MSDTPETDNFIVSAGYVRTDHQWRTFARKLERGRNNLQDQRDFAMVEIERLRKERDEALKTAAMWEKVALREASMNGARCCEEVP